MMKMRFFTILLMLTVSMSVTPECSAQFWKKKKTEQIQDTVRKENEYEKFFKESPQTAEGFIRLHKMKDKLYFELPLDLLGRDMLLGSTITEVSDNANGIVGSKPFDPLHFRFRKINDKVCMELVQTDNVVAGDDLRLQESLERSSIGAIIKAFKIEVYTPDSSAVVFDATDFFVGDNKRMSPFDPNSANIMKGVKRSESFQSDKSFLSEIKAFEDNVLIRSHLTYTYTLTGKKSGLPENEPFSVVMTRSIVMLPDQAARPRITDSRIAVFPTGKYQYSASGQRVKTVYYANRWRLEPSDMESYRSGMPVEPVKPITFYIDRDFPENWKESIKEGVSQWNELFAGIGFRNAVRVLDFPDDDPEFDPDNIKYSCIRYAPIPIANAMGPLWVDPRSGEIINASVYIYHDVIKLLNNWLFVQTAQTDQRVRSATIPDEIIMDALRYVVSHEIGHCLGFMHNMSASAVIPVDSLRSPSFTGKYGTTTSIMDYARFNYVAQPGDFQRGVKLTPPRFGEYDRFLVKWNYTPVPDAQSAEDEYKTTSQWLADASSNPVLRYGKQQGEVIDPRSQNEDLGDDAVKASAYGIKNLKYILSHLNEWLDGQDYDYSYRTDIYDAVLMQYVTYINHVYANVGGIYLNEKHTGDDVDSYASVPAARQKEAVKFLLDQISDLQWLDNRELMGNLTLMGSPAGVLCEVVLRAVVSLPGKVELSAAKSTEKQPYTVKECMDDVFDYIWRPALQGKALTAGQMKMQRLFLEAVASEAGMKIVSGAKSLTTARTIDIEGVSHQEFSGCLCGGHHNHYDGFSGHGAVSPVAAYGEPLVNYNIPKDYSSLYFGYMQKIRSISIRNSNHADKDTAAHYQLMLRNIDKALKK